MGTVVGAILILAASVLVGAGIIADGFNRGQGFAGYVLGGIVGLFGFAFLVSGPLIRAAKPVDDEKLGSPQ